MSATSKIYIVCSGLGNIRRGFEAFFRNCFDALKDDDRIELWLFKGGGKSQFREKLIFNLRREGRLAKAVGRLIGRSGYFVECVTFFVALFPRLVFKSPDVIYVSDVVLANLLRLAKVKLNLKYRVLYDNNGPTDPHFLHRWDHIQQVVPAYLEDAVAVGVPPDKQTLLPCALPINKIFSPNQPDEQKVLRQKLKLPTDRRIIISVGSLSHSRKRMDYLIREVAQLPEPRPFLLLLGARAVDTPEIDALGNKLLSESGFSARSVAQKDVAEYYRAADCFVLASVDEGFGLVYVEALAHGLPCIVHDYSVARYVLGEQGIYGDLSKSGSLSELLQKHEWDCVFNPSAATLRHKYAYNKFSFDALKDAHIELFLKVATPRQEPG